jgi:hypothetical protein
MFLQSSAMSWGNHTIFPPPKDTGQKDSPHQPNDADNNGADNNKDNNNNADNNNVDKDADDNADKAATMQTMMMVQPQMTMPPPR